MCERGGGEGGSFGRKNQCHRTRFRRGCGREFDISAWRLGDGRGSERVWVGQLLPDMFSEFR